MKYHKDKLNLPFFKYAGPPTEILSMEDYLKFIIFSLKYPICGKKYVKNKKNLPVNIPFSLK